MWHLRSEYISHPLPLQGVCPGITLDREEGDLEEVDGFPVVFWQVPGQLVPARAADVEHVFESTLDLALEKKARKQEIIVKQYFLFGSRFFFVFYLWQ